MGGCWRKDEPVVNWKSITPGKGVELLLVPDTQRPSSPAGLNEECVAAFVNSGNEFWTLWTDGPQSLIPRMQPALGTGRARLPSDP